VEYFMSKNCKLSQFDFSFRIHKMSFFINLPSNGSQKYFSENRIANFRIKLPSKVILNPGEFEVALVEATYICSFKTLTGLNGDNEISILIETGTHADVLKVIIPLTH